MITVVATMKALDGQADTLIEALTKSAEQARLEQGNLKYDVFRSISDPAAVLVHEQYVDQAALDAHGASDHVKGMFRVLKTVLAGRPEIRVFNDA